MLNVEDEYNFIRKLSRENTSRFGITSLMENKLTGEKVVLKSVRTDKELGFQQLKNEAQFDFDQTGLPKIYSTQIEKDKYLILKPFVEGVTLEQFWKKIPKRKRITTLKELTNSLLPLFEKLDKEGIIHGDIKPENILVEEKEHTIQCHLIDFGLAFKTNNLPERKTIFQLAYAPPEIILNQLQCANQGSDIFSFCLIIYKLWAGKLPFTNSNPALLTQLQITHPIERPWRFDKKLWAILEKGLQKHQFRRSPNRMKRIEVKEVLLENNRKRYSDFSNFAGEIATL